MKRLLMNTSGLFLAFLVATSFTAVANPQGTGPAGKFYTKAEVEAVIKRVEERSDAFRKVVDRTLDRSALDGTNREDNINQQVKELENAIDKLRSDFDRSNTWQETRGQVQQVLSEADEVNAIVRRGRWRRGGAVKSEWALVRNDLNRLAGVYNLPLLRA